MGRGTLSPSDEADDGERRRALQRYDAVVREVTCDGRRALRELKRQEETYGALADPALLQALDESLASARMLSNWS